MAKRLISAAVSNSCASGLTDNCLPDRPAALVWTGTGVRTVLFFLTISLISSCKRTVSNQSTSDVVKSCICVSQNDHKCSSMCCKGLCRLSEVKEGRGHLHYQQLWQHFTHLTDAACSSIRTLGASEPIGQKICQQSTLTVCYIGHVGFLPSLPLAW